MTRECPEQKKILPACDVCGVCGKQGTPCPSKVQRGTVRHFLDSYLTEFMWRQSVKNQPDPFDALLDAIASQWPPE